MDTVNPSLEAIENQRWKVGNIYWEQVVKFKNDVSSASDSLITSFYDDRIKLSSQALAQAIAFYNNLLERQQRYQQETLKQRAIEKSWLDWQHQKLTQVQSGIEKILNLEVE